MKVASGDLITSPVFQKPAKLASVSSPSDDYDIQVLHSASPRDRFYETLKIKGPYDEATLLAAENYILNKDFESKNFDYNDIIPEDSDVRIALHLQGRFAKAYRSYLEKTIAKFVRGIEEDQIQEVIDNDRHHVKLFKHFDYERQNFIYKRLCRMISYLSFLKREEGLYKKLYSNESNVAGLIASSDCAERGLSVISNSLQEVDNYHADLPTYFRFNRAYNELGPDHSITVKLAFDNVSRTVSSESKRSEKRQVLEKHGLYELAKLLRLIIERYAYRGYAFGRDASSTFQTVNRLLKANPDINYLVRYGDKGLVLVPKEGVEADRIPLNF